MYVDVFGGGDKVYFSFVNKDMLSFVYVGEKVFVSGYGYVVFGGDGEMCVIL